MSLDRRKFLSSAALGAAAAASIPAASIPALANDDEARSLGDGTPLPWVQTRFAVNIEMW